MKHTFVGIGLGPIQSGLFLYEAHRSGAFDRLVVAEVVPDVVEAVRGNDGAFALNIAHRDGIATCRVDGIEIYNPAVPGDLRRLVDAAAHAHELATALPSVSFYERGRPSVADWVAEAVSRKLDDPTLPPAVLYAAENHNHAAERMGAALRARLSPEHAARMGDRAQVLNTVIGKMSGVLRDPGEIRTLGAAPAFPDGEMAYLVEAFNRILVSRIELPGFRRGIEVFEEKPDLLPFEEAKLYGHNAVHALLGYLAGRRGCTVMSEVAAHTDLLRTGRDAFLGESGRALCVRHRGVDDLFTPDGFAGYADDLLDRMTNPHLRDRIERVIRDPRRKLGWEDRLVGTMRMALAEGVQPVLFARGAAAALDVLRAEEDRGDDDASLLADVWGDAGTPAERDTILRVVGDAKSSL